MKPPARIAFLFDVDNTLFDNDAFERELRVWLDREIGPGSADAYWRSFEAQRARLDFVDFLGSVQQCWDASGRDPRWLPLGDHLLDYAFDRLLYPGALDAIHRLGQHGTCWLISDGDGVMQPRKLRRSGLWDAVAGRVRIYVHKELMWSDIQNACGAHHYVMIDDKPRILQAVQAQWGRRVTTVQPLQGHYALESAGADPGWHPDLALAQIGMLAQADNELLAILNSI